MIELGIKRGWLFYIGLLSTYYVEKWHLPRALNLGMPQASLKQMQRPWGEPARCILKNTSINSCWEEEQAMMQGWRSAHRGSMIKSNFEQSTLEI